MSKRLLIAVLADKKLEKLQELAFNTTLAKFAADVVYFGNFTAEEQKIGKRVAVGEAGRHLLLQVNSILMANINENNMVTATCYGNCNILLMTIMKGNFQSSRLNPHNHHL